MYSSPGLAKKAARKIHAITASSSESTSQSSSDEDMYTDPDTDGPSTPVVKVEEEQDGLGRFGPGQIIDLTTPPRINVPLPQLGPEALPQSTSTVPPRLFTALEHHTGKITYLHQTRRLPFLLRNVRRGFLLRCKDAGISLNDDLNRVMLGVRYDHVDGIFYETSLHQWTCPICSIHGPFPNLAVLQKHLEWDHKELFTEWLFSGNSVSVFFSWSHKHTPIHISANLPSSSRKSCNPDQNWLTNNLRRTGKVYHQQTLQKIAEIVSFPWSSSLLRPRHRHLALKVPYPYPQHLLLPHLRRPPPQLPLPSSCRP